MISLIDYVTYRKEEGPVKIIRLPHFGVEFHWDSDGDKIIQEIRGQLHDASFYRKKYDCWVLAKENKECHLYFSDIPGYELLKLEFIVKQIYEYTREQWQKIWSEKELDLNLLKPSDKKFSFGEPHDTITISNMKTSPTHPYAIHGLERNIAIKESKAARAEIISIEVCQSKHGGFLKSMAHAFHKADRGNKEIIRNVWYELIEKYNLEKEYKQAIEEHLPEYLGGK